MEPLAFITAVLIVLGGPALAAVWWRRALDAPADAIELAALAYGGVALAALAVWLGATLAGPSWPVVVAASLAGTLLPLVPALRRAALQRAVGGRRQALSGQHDGRVVPEAVAQGAAPPAGAPAGNRHFALLAAAGAGYAFLVWLPFLTYGWQRADGVHRMAMTDWYKHLVSTTALAAADTFPPPNPFVHAVAAAPYYYGFHLVAASLARLSGALGGVSPGELVYPALLVLTLITAAATPFVAYTAARTIAAGKGDAIGDTASVPLLAALGGTFLAGFDLVPLAIDTAVNLAGGAGRLGGLAGLRAAIPSTHLDYWIHHNERQFNAPYLSTLWAPQHMAAVLVALLALHLVLRRRQLAERGAAGAPPGAGWLLPALLLAALPALSAYVALGLAIAVAGAIIIESVRGRCLLWQTRGWRQWRVPGLAAAVLALPVLALLAGGGGGGLTVRVSAAGGWSNGALWSALFGPGWFTGMVDSVAVYALELGVIGVLAAAEIRRMASQRRLQPHQQHVVWMVLSLMVAVVFVRPPAGEPNNLYARPLVVAWFALAPFAAMRLARLGGLVSRTGGAAGGELPATSRAHRGHRGGRPRWALAALLLCLLGNAYALLGVLLEGALFWATPTAAVEATRWINEHASPDAVIAVAPDEFLSGFGYWLRRPLALADERHALLFGATGDEYQRVARELRRARTTADPRVAAAALRAAGGNALLVARAGGDPAWLQSPCFMAPFRNDEWLVALPVDGTGCDER